MKAHCVWNVTYGELLVFLHTDESPLSGLAYPEIE